MAPDDISANPQAQELEGLRSF